MHCLSRSTSGARGARIHPLPYGIVLTVKGFVFRTDPDHVNLTLGLIEDSPTFPLTTDYYGVGSSDALCDPSFPMPDTITHFISWQLSGHDVLDTTDLPTVPPVLSAWSGNDLMLYSLDRNSGGFDDACYVIRGEVLSATLSPPAPLSEPAAMVLLGAGLAGLAGLRQWFKR